MSLFNFYRSKEWVSLLQVLKLERVDDTGNIICEYCGKPIVRAYDCIGHHKIHLTEENYTDSNISLNPDNIALVHHRCHNHIHNKLGYSQREVFLVYGSPLAGKSTWVNQVAQAGDLIVDIDSIWECVSGQARYVKPNRLKSVVFNVRDNLLESVRYRRGKWNNAYIIGGYPYRAERERLIAELGAREVFIHIDEAEAIRRLEEQTERDRLEWIKYIEDWFNIYSGGY